MLRLLGQAQYGLYNFVGSIVAYLGLLNFGLNGSYIRFYVRYHADNDSESIAILNGMFLTMYLCLSLLILSVGGWFVMDSSIIFGSELSVVDLKTARVLLTIMVFNLAISLPISLFGAYIVAHEKFVYQKIMELIRIVVSPFMILPILFMGYGAVGIVAVSTTIGVIMSVFNIAFCFKKLKMQLIFNRFDFALMREISLFSSFVFLNVIIDQISWSVDKYILGRVRGTISVAVYSIAANLNLYYVSFSTAISSIFTTKINKIVADKKSDDNKLTNLFVVVGRMQFIILALICSGLIIFGMPFITMWAGEGYRKAYFVLLLLILPETVPLIQNTGLAIQRAKNMHKFRSVIYFFVVLINIGISIPLAKEYGEIGAAFGTSVSLIICPVFIMNWYYHKKIGINMFKFWKEILHFVPALVIPLLFGGVIYLYVDLYNWVLFIVSGALYTCIYCLSMWRFGMNKVEKQLFVSPVVLFFNKIRKMN